MSDPLFSRIQALVQSAPVGTEFTLASVVAALKLEPGSRRVLANVSHALHQLSAVESTRAGGRGRGDTAIWRRNPWPPAELTTPRRTDAQAALETLGEWVGVGASPYQPHL